MICSASCTICGASSEATTLRLFILSAKPIGEQLLHARRARRHRVELGAPAPCTLLRIACSCTDDFGQARRRRRHRARVLARLGAHERRARARRASAAMPSHSAAHRMCEYGTIVCAERVGERAGQDLLLGPDDSSLKPGLQVPRMPSVSQVLVCSSVQSALAHQHQHLIARRRVRRAAAGDEEGVGVLAVRDGGRVLVELKRAACRARPRRCWSACRRTCRPPTSPTRSAAAARRAPRGSCWKNGDASAVARDARDLDVVHREHHGARARSPGRAPCTSRRARACRRRRRRTPAAPRPRAAGLACSASKVSCGNRALASTSSAWPAATSLYTDRVLADDFAARPHGQIGSSTAANSIGVSRVRRRRAR